MAWQHYSIVCGDYDDDIYNHYDGGFLLVDNDAATVLFHDRFVRNALAHYQCEWIYIIHI